MLCFSNKLNHCCYRCFQFKVCILSYIRFTLNRTAVSNALNTIWIGFKIKSWDHYEYGRIIMTDPMICEEELSLDLAKACEFRSGSFCLQKGIFSTTLFSFNIWIKYIFTQKSNLWKKSSESKYYRLKNPPFPMGTGKFKNSVFTNIPILYNNLLQKWVTTSWTDGITAFFLSYEFLLSGLRIRVGSTRLEQEFKTGSGSELILKIRIRKKITNKTKQICRFFAANFSRIYQMQVG